MSYHTAAGSHHFLLKVVSSVTSNFYVSIRWALSIRASNPNWMCSSSFFAMIIFLKSVFAQHTCCKTDKYHNYQQLKEWIVCNLKQCKHSIYIVPGLLFKTGLMQVQQHLLKSVNLISFCLILTCSVCPSLWLGLWWTTRQPPPLLFPDNEHEFASSCILSNPEGDFCNLTVII